MNLIKERNYLRTQIAVDAKRYSNAGVPITCRANCSNCCHVKVSCFPDEIDNIISLGVEIDMDKLELQVKDWNNSNKNCVFLKDGNCSIHENKPLSCISHLVNSPAENCKIDSRKAPHMIRVKTVLERLVKLRKENKTVLLHESLYERLN